MGMFFSNRYEIIRRIGKGSLGQVYLVKKENEYYALKKISIYKIDSNLYNKKINVLSNISSEYIIKYYESFIEKEYFCILMEYGGNLNLKEFVKIYKDKNKLIGEKLIKNIIEQICFGLRDMYKFSIIHKNLTLDNILINDNKNIKICDFCLSKKLNSSHKHYKADIFIRINNI